MSEREREREREKERERERDLLLSLSFRHYNKYLERASWEVTLSFFFGTLVTQVLLHLHVITKGIDITWLHEMLIWQNVYI